jgi:PKD repeat protein
VSGRAELLLRAEDAGDGRDFDHGDWADARFTCGGGGGGNRAPTARATATPSSGPAPLTVDFDGSASTDPDPGDTLAFAWDLDGDGAYDDAAGATARTTYASAGTVVARLRVTDGAGASSVTDPLTITVSSGTGGTTTRYVSDLPLTQATNGWGPVELDRSNAEQAAGDGGPITIGGRVYQKGLGVHSLSEVRVAVPAGCTGFAADVGVDDEIGDRGSLRFRVYADGVEVADSGVRSGTDATLALDADVSGRAELLLRAEDAGDGRDFDHGDWADARFTCGVASNTPPVPTIATPDGTAAWAVDDLISFSGGGVDAEDGPLGPEALSWTLAVEHCPSNCHTHVARTWDGVVEGSFTAPDHEYPSHLELRLTATDSGGASATATVRLDPRTVEFRFESEPAGLRLVVGSEGAVTPFTRTVIAGSTSSVSAESPQTLDGRSYAFASWSDGGAATHLVVASADATLKATYTPVNGAPTARATATPSSGPAPLTVDFDGSASTDPDPGDTLSFAWDLDGDGAYDDATGPTARTTYTTPGAVTARLRVTDGAGNAATSDPLEITAANTPPRPAIDAPSAGTRWAVGDVVAFAGGADDDQDGALPASRLDWALVLHPCGTCAPQTLQRWSGTASGTFTAPDAPYPATLELELTATDAHGATAVATRSLDPRTVTLSFATSPTGLSLDVGGAAPTPFERTATVGSTVAVAAPSPQALGPDTYDFASWSDGGAAAHAITAPPAAATYTATFTARAGACPAGQWRAEYFTNRTLSGSPALTRCELAIDYSWGTGSPATGIGTNNFSVRWTGRFSFLGGSTTFTATTNDGMRVRLDGALVIDQWRDQSTTTYLSLRTVTAGTHDVSVEFYDRSGTAVARASWREGLVAAYNFDESTGGTVLDRSANGNAGTISGATRTSSGRNGRAVSFDGVNDWVTIADAGTLDLSTGMTLEAWVYPTALGSATRAVVAKEAPGTLRYGLYGNTSSRPGARVDISGGRTTIGTAQLPLNTWTHLAATFDGATLRLFVNGVQVSSIAATGAIAASSGPLRIGGHAVAGEWFAGRIDDVRVYSRALSAAEIQADRDAAVP